MLKFLFVNKIHHENEFCNSLTHKTQHNRWYPLYTYAEVVWGTLYELINKRQSDGGGRTWCILMILQNFCQERM